MRHLHLLLMAFFFLSAVQVHAAKATKKAKTTVTQSQQRRASVSGHGDGMTIRMTSAAPKANVGGTSCSYKNASVSPFSKEGKLTAKAAARTAINANRPSTGIN